MDNNTEVNKTQETQTEEKTFTQAELNAIVQKRLGEEKARYENYEELKAKAQKFDQIEEESKTELQKATERAEALQKELEAIKTANEERQLRERIAQETGVPASLLRGNSEEDLKAQAEAIMTFAKASGPSYPKVKDGGEVTPPAISKQDILGIKNEKERLKAIKENIELFK